MLCLYTLYTSNHLTGSCRGFQVQRREQLVCRILGRWPTQGVGPPRSSVVRNRQTFRRLARQQSLFDLIGVRRFFAMAQPFLSKVGIRCLTHIGACKNSPCERQSPAVSPKLNF